jgi:hypothetical protein
VEFCPDFEAENLAGKLSAENGFFEKNGFLKRLDESTSFGSKQSLTLRSRASNLSVVEI